MMLRRYLPVLMLAMVLFAPLAASAGSPYAKAREFCRDDNLARQRAAFTEMSDTTGLTTRHGCLSREFYVGSSMDTLNKVCTSRLLQGRAVDEIWLTKHLRRYMRDRAVDHGCGDFPVDRDRVTLSTLRSELLGTIRRAHPEFIQEWE